jgi:serine/threonine-protein kinase
MAIVYEGVIVESGVRVAIKRLHPRLADPTNLERFEREATAVASLGHPGIVQVHDFHRDPAFIVMERVEGVSLGELIRRDGPLSAGRVVSMAVQVLSALSAVHAAGVIHRDLKSSNIMLGRRPGAEVAKVLDFGVAKVRSLTGRRTITLDGDLLGTPAYMAPEHIVDGEADHRSDLYSLGVVLYYALSGARPFESGDLCELLTAIIADPPRDLGALCPELHPRLVEVVMRALAKMPSDRFASATDMAAALLPFLRTRDAAVAGSGVRPRAVDVPTQLARPH